MTSIGPYTEKTNLSYMFEKQDLRGPLPQITETHNSITYILSNTPNFSKFTYILKLSKLDKMFSEPLSSFTIFAPIDEHLQHITNNILINMDLLTARNIILASTLQNRITSDILEDSLNSYFNTLASSNRLYVTNYNDEIIIDNNIKIIKEDIKAVNGIIQATSGLIHPYIF